MSGNTNSFGLWDNNGNTPEVRETVWTTVTDGDTSIHVAHLSALGNPEIDARSAHFILGAVDFPQVSEIGVHPLDRLEEAIYLGHTVHKKGRP